MGTAQVLDEMVERLRSRPRSTGVLTDFDGTLAPIVEAPEAARLLEGAAETLAALARRYRRVAVLSGRPVAFLAPFVPPSVVVSGLYGLEVLRDGRRRDHPSAGSWREVVEDVAAVSAVTGPPGMRVERKGLSLTLHYRGRPQIEDDVHRWAVRQAARSGLECRPAKMSFELHPPIRADKGTAVLDLAARLDAVCFVGDDLGDLPAFAALDELAGRGVHIVRVAVASTEAPAELLGRADAVVDGPEGALGFLRRLL